jgi:hypothetical protein
LATYSKTLLSKGIILSECDLGSGKSYL